MGLDVYLYSKAEAASEDYAHEDVPSEKYPDHLFNRRYLRSSYNGSGFNSAVSDFIGGDSDLYWIFEGVKRDEHEEAALTAESIPALEEAKDRALSVADRLRGCDRLRVHTPSAGIIGPQDHLWPELPSADKVLDWYRSETARTAIPVSYSVSYSTGKGAVYHPGFTILAIALGRDQLGRPAPVVVYRADDETLDSYIQSAEIIAEFCDEAIGLIQRDGEAQIFWSA